MIRILALLVALLPALAGNQALAQTLPSRDNPYVNDTKNLLSTQAKTALSLKLASLHLRDGVEMAVLTTSSRADFGYEGPLEQFSQDIFADWNLGATTGNDGILVMIALDEDMMRIELGTAYPDSVQPTLQSILDEVFIPAFVDGRAEDAIVQGCDALISQIALANHAGAEMGADMPAQDATDDAPTAPADDTSNGGPAPEAPARRPLSGSNS